jgi:hypothetical protein
LLLVLREQAGLDLAALVLADGGESASTFLATGRDGTVSVPKIGPDAAGDSVGRLHELVTGLRRRGYPAARLLASGQVAGTTFWLQERLPGTVLDRVPGWLLPEVLRLNDAQAGLGDGTCQLPGLIAETLTAGGDGYCVHATLEARPDTWDLLAVRLLTVVSSPGSQTRAAPVSTGFLCIENPDPAAATVKRLMREADIGPREMTPWNACPWFTDSPQAGVEPWVQLIRLLPDLRVLMLMGGDAQSGWRRARQRHPALLPGADVKIICTYSPGQQALRHPDPAERARREEDRKTAFHQAAAYSKT